MKSGFYGFSKKCIALPILSFLLLMFSLFAASCRAQISPQAAATKISGSESKNTATTETLKYINYEKPVILWLNNKTLLSDPPQSSTVSEGNPAVEKVSSVDDGFVVAVSETGLFAFKLDNKKKTAVVSANIGEDFFHGRTIGSLFKNGDDTICHLFINDIRPNTNRTVLAPVILSLGTDDNMPTAFNIPAKGNVLNNIFWIFPIANGNWLVQTREISSEKIFSAWFSYNLSKDELKPISRDIFENSSLSSIAGLPASAESLKNGSPAIVFSRNIDGTRSVIRLGSGLPENAREWYAAGNKLHSICLGRDGKGWLVNRGKSEPVTIEMPREKTVIIDVAYASDVFMIAWQEDHFPQIGASGVVIFPVH